MNSVEYRFGFGVRDDQVVHFLLEKQTNGNKSWDDFFLPVQDQIQPRWGDGHGHSDWGYCCCHEQAKGKCPFGHFFWSDLSQSTHKSCNHNREKKESAGDEPLHANLF
jgi:hypothetical protein